MCTEPGEVKLISFRQKLRCLTFIFAATGWVFLSYFPFRLDIVI